MHHPTVYKNPEQNQPPFGTPQSALESWECVSPAQRPPESIHSGCGHGEGMVARIVECAARSLARQFGPKAKPINHLN